MSSPYIMLTGPLLVGSLLSYFFFGAFFLQLYVYITQFLHSDKKFFVGLVCLVSIAEVLHLTFSTHTAYTLLAEGFADASSLAQAPWSGSTLPMLNGFVSFCTQVFFAWRVYRLGKKMFSRVSAAAILSLALMQFGASIAVTVQFNHLGLEIDLVKTLNRTIIVWLAGTLACDILMTASIIIVLMVYKKATAYEESKSMIDTFIAHTIENGLLTTICAALNLIFFLVYPDNFLYVCLEFILGRLYANVLMATLNRRDSKRLTANTEEMSTRTDKSSNGAALPLSNLRSFNHLNNTSHNGTLALGRTTPNASAKMYSGGPVVSITTEVQVDDDDSASQKHVKYAI